MAKNTNNNVNNYKRNLILNSTAYIEWVDRLSQIAKSTFKWEGLPDTVDSRFLEKLLFNYGRAGIYDNKEYGIVCSQISPIDNYNLYDYPTAYLAHSRVWHETIPFEEMVVCRNNTNETPTVQAVERYAYKLATIERAIENNLEGQNYSYLIKCDKSELQTIQNIVAKHQTGEPIIIGSKGLNIDINSINITPPFVADKLLDLYHSTYNECMRFFGVMASGEDKAERVQSAEIEAVNGELSINLETQLKYRKECCNQLNEKYGTKATVSIFNDEEIESVNKIGENENG